MVAIPRIRLSTLNAFGDGHAHAIANLYQMVEDGNMFQRFDAFF